MGIGKPPGTGILAMVTYRQLHASLDCENSESFFFAKSLLGNHYGWKIVDMIVRETARDKTSSGTGRAYGLEIDKI